MATANELADQIMEIIHHADPVAAFEALADCYAFKLSLLACPDCRKQAIKALVKAAPGMLRHANELAADYANAGASPLPSEHTHH